MNDYFVVFADDLPTVVVRAKDAFCALERALVETYPDRWTVVLMRAVGETNLHPNPANYPDYVVVEGWHYVPFTKEQKPNAWAFLAKN